MIPYSLESSDSIFNLGCAVVAVQLLPPRVSLKMSRNIFTWGNCRKNKGKGSIETIKELSQILIVCFSSL